MKLRAYETAARYILGVIFLFGAIEGWLEILFHIYLIGDGTGTDFYPVLQRTTFFWVLLKGTELLGAISLLLNYKPALGLALLTPISVVMCLFYIFVLKWWIALTLVGGSTIILLKAYSKSYMPLLDPYSR